VVDTTTDGALTLSRDRLLQATSTVVVVTANSPTNSLRHMVHQDGAAVPLAGAARTTLLDAVGPRRTVAMAATAVLAVLAALGDTVGPAHMATRAHLEGTDRRHHHRTTDTAATREMEVTEEMEGTEEAVRPVTPPAAALPSIKPAAVRRAGGISNYRPRSTRLLTAAFLPMERLLYTRVLIHRYIGASEHRHST
jgi:hypothetical protein